MSEDIVYRLRKRAEIRRQIPTRKSVQNNEPDRMADLLEEAAAVIEDLRLANRCYEQGRKDEKNSHSEEWWKHEISNAFAEGYIKGRASYE